MRRALLVADLPVKLLLEIQVFMGDNIRAALTCVRQFRNARDTVLQLKYLDAAQVRSALLGCCLVSSIGRAPVNPWLDRAIFKKP